MGTRFVQVMPFLESAPHGWKGLIRPFWTSHLLAGFCSVASAKGVPLVSSLNLLFLFLPVPGREDHHRVPNCSGLGG